MKVIREHCTNDHIKTNYSKVDFKKQHSAFNFPTALCTSDKSSKIIGKYFNRKRYVTEMTNEFKRTAAEYFVPKVRDTPKVTLLNYPSYKYFQKVGKENSNIRYLCEVLVSKHLAATIATRRAAWVEIFWYNFLNILDFSNQLIAAEILVEKDVDKIAALFGIKCHQRGVEPYFPSTSFISGVQYDYSSRKDGTKKNNNQEGIDSNKDKKKDNIKHRELKGDTKLYACTDDCIGATDEQSKSFKNLVHTYGKATKKNIRNIIDKYDECSNIELDDIYLLTREKRNHPKICYEHGCQSYSVLIRKLAIHYKHCRKFMQYMITLNNAHQFIHDIDVATVLGDIDYLIKLLAMPTDKAPSVFDTRDCPPIENKNYDVHIAEFEKMCLDLPDIVCKSCDMLEYEKNMRYPKDWWKAVQLKLKDDEGKDKDTAWDEFKKMLVIEHLKGKNIQVCNYCVTNYNKNKIPPRSKLNDMDPGDVPKEIAVLTPIELMFIAPVKVFQTVVKLGAVGKHVPHNSRLSALKGNAIHIPLPLEQTIKQLQQETDFTKIPAKYIITHHIKNDELLLRNLVNLDNVHAALMWLKKNNPIYKEINIPTRPESLFSSVLSKESSDLLSSGDNESDLDSGSQTLNSSNACHIPKKKIPLQSKSSDMEVQSMPADSKCPSQSNEETVLIDGKDQEDVTASNDHIIPTNRDTDETSVNINVQKNPESMIEALEEDTESNRIKMIKKLSSHQVQSLFEQYSVVNNDREGKTIMESENFFQFIRINAPPLPNTEPHIDLKAFLNIFPMGIAGQNSFRREKLTHYFYEKTRLLSARSHVRRNIPHLFYLFHGSERRAINQGVFITMNNVKCLNGKNVEQLKQMLQNDAPAIERNLNRVVSKIPNSPSYWNGPRSMLKCMSETYGPATFFITFSPAEYDWPDLHAYLMRHNKDVEMTEGMSVLSLLTMDPVLTSIYIHQKFQALLNFILKSCCLGTVEHWFYRVEYQSRGSPHFHCMFWIKDAPIIGQSSDVDVMKFINEHITCHFPSKSENSELHDLVNKYLNHGCGLYCKRTLKSRTGKFKKSCRFSFPRKITSKMILNDVIESIVGRKISNFQKRLYHLPRTKEEVRINDYNPALLKIWRANMDIQYIGEDTYSLVQYTTKYVTKPDKSHLTNDDFGIYKSTISRLWHYAFRILRGREIGAYEACDRWFLKDLFEFSDIFQFISTLLPEHRSKMLKTYTDLEKADSKSTDIFNKDMLSTFYPERPNTLENVTLKDYAANYVRGYPTNKQKKSDTDERSEENAMSCKNDSFIKLNGNNGYMKKRPKEALVYHPEFDPRVYPEKYYYSLLMLLKPWRNEAELKGKCKTYQESFQQNLTEYPQLQVYNNLKQKIVKSRDKVEDEVTKKNTKN